MGRGGQRLARVNQTALTVAMLLLGFALSSIAVAALGLTREETRGAVLRFVGGSGRARGLVGCGKMEAMTVSDFVPV